ncbi:MAG: hypothetical protein R3B95_10750 [Nitrospirales bacterium]|nr:hypothetical protein [Nitrospirales bacterium]
MFRFNVVAAVLVITLGLGWQKGLAMAAEAHSITGYGFGHMPSDRELQGWDIDVRLDRCRPSRRPGELW